MSVSICSTASSPPRLPLQLPLPTCAMSRSFRGEVEARKKLRARRLPRSLSDGEHVGFLAYGLRVPSPGLPCLSDSDEEDAQGESLPVPNMPKSLTRCSFAEGGGEGLVERADGDGGSEASGYEWDDYKPPRHDETGPMEESLDASRINSFGDDYGLAGLPCPPHPSDPIHSLGSHLGPLGDSDSELEDVRPLLAHSGRQLLRTRASAPTAGPAKLADLVATAETHLRCLGCLSAHLLSLGPKAQTRQEDYHTATRLLKEWQDLLFSLRSSAGVSAPVRLSNRVLEDEIRRLSGSLEDLVTSGQLNASIASGSYANPQELTEAIELLQGLHSRLEEERGRLRLLAGSVGLASEPVPEDPSGGPPPPGEEPVELRSELQTLCAGCDAALASCAHQLSDLARLREAWSDWDSTLPALNSLLSRLEAGVGQLESKSEDQRPSVAAVETELGSCQERLGRLESLMGLLSRESGQAADFASQLTDLSAHLRLLEARFAALSAPEASSQSPRRRCRTKGTQATAAFTAPRVRQEPKRTNWWSRGLALMLLLCVSLASLPLLLNEPWGPRLDYVRGPPPS